MLLSCISSLVDSRIAHDMRNTVNVPSRQLMLIFAAARPVEINVQVLSCLLSVSLTSSTLLTDVAGLFMDEFLPSNSKAETGETIK